MKKLLGWVAVIGVIAWLLKNPATAAADVRHVFTAIGQFVGGL